jgi:formylglycine-generating enzyme required for sulfatase activity
LSRPPHCPPSGTDGDFARLLSELPEADPAGLARLLGRALRPARGAELVETRVSEPRQGEIRWPISQIEGPFWRVVKTSPGLGAVGGQPVEQQLTNEDLGPSAFRYGAAPEAEAACPWPQLEARLCAALAGQRPSRSLDLPAALRTISRAEPLERLPRTARPAWPRAVVVLNDRDPRLMPLVADHAMVINALRRLVGHASVHLVELGEPALRRAAAAAGTWARRLPEAEVVLLLSDLGALDGPHATTRAAWAGLCAALHGAGRRLVALSPTGDAPAGIPAGALGWGGRPLLAREARDERAEDLAALLSLSCWAPRGLLRDLRRLLGPQRADLVTELDVWQRPGAAVHGGQLALSAADLAALRGRLARALAGQDKTLCAQTVGEAELLAREWSRVNPPEARIGDRVALNLALRGLPAEAEDAAWLDRLRGTLRSGLGPKEAPARAWAAVGRRLAQSVPPERLSEPAGEQLRVVQIWSEQRQLVPDGHALPDAAPERWAVRQVGQQLILEPEPEVVHPDVPAAAHRPGSPVGWLLAKQTLVVVRDGQRGGPKPLVQGLSVPFDGAKTLSLDTGVETLTLGLVRRADDGGWERMGRDCYGLWAEIDVKGAKAEATQRFRWINPGRFLMGSPDDEVGRRSDEGPLHEVTLSEGYWMADTPVTQALYLAVIGENPSQFTQPPDLLRPVEQVRWPDSVAFVRRLSGLRPSGAPDGSALQLPSEAQWERACRAGTTTPTYAPAGKGLDHIARTYSNSMGSTHRVGQLLPNAWGLFDTLGNVWEWCADLAGEYPDGPRTDPLGAGVGPACRGGSWRDRAQNTRAACRFSLAPSIRSDDLGLRLSRGRAHQRPASSDP